MSEENTVPESVQATEPVAAVPVAERQVFKMADDLISMIRELVQLSLLTGTNVVDHFRALQMEATEEKPSYLTVTPEYVQAYNTMILKLNEEAKRHQEEMQKTPAIED